MAIQWIAVLVALSSVAAAFIHSDPAHGQHGMLIDELGRERIFHGVNVVYKTAPYYPSNGTFTPDTSLNDDDIAFLAKNGFNVVRLYVAWPAVEPQRGAYQLDYLAAVKDIVHRLAAADIYVILDMHQDLWSQHFCGEGAPEFATLYHNRSKPSKPFPEPIAPEYPVNATTGFPYLSDCGNKSFFLYMLSDAVSKAVQSFYDNEQGIQDAFVAFWRLVAQTFADESHVLGLELINEPWVGDFYTHPDQLKPLIADSRNLAPLYARLHTAIRQVDDNHIIFFEPTVLITQLPLVEFSRTGLKEGPGGPAYNDRQVYAFHDYCQILTGDGQPLSPELCTLIDKDAYFKTKTDDLKQLGTAGFITEWGALNNGTGKDAEYTQGLLSHFDEHFLSWAYWQLKSYNDITTQAREPTGQVEEGLWDDAGNVDAAKLKLLTYTYPMAVAGNVTDYHFDWDQADFTLQFNANTTITAPTVIFASQPNWYPASGPVFYVNPTDVLTGSFVAATNQLVFQFTGLATTGMSITIRVARQ